MSCTFKIHHLVHLEKNQKSLGTQDRDSGLFGTSGNFCFEACQLHSPFLNLDATIGDHVVVALDGHLFPRLQLFEGGHILDVGLEHPDASGHVFPLFAF